MPKPNFNQQPMSSALKAGLPPTPTATGPRPASTAAPLPAIRYAAAAAAAVAPSQPPPPPSATAPPPSTTATAPPPLAPSPPSAPPVSASPVASSAASPPSASRTAEPSAPPPPPSAAVEQAQRSPAPLSAIPTDPSSSTQSPVAQPMQVQVLLQQQQLSSSSSTQQGARPASRSDGARLPNALADLVSSFENAKQRCTYLTHPPLTSRSQALMATTVASASSPAVASQRAGDMDQLHSALDASFQALPHPQDAEKFIPAHPRPSSLLPLTLRLLCPGRATISLRTRTRRRSTTRRSRSRASRTRTSTPSSTSTHSSTSSTTTQTRTSSASPRLSLPCAYATRTFR